MKLKFFWIPAADSAAAEEELNVFLAGHRVVNVEKAFAQPDGSVGWSICVQWEPGEATGGISGVKRSKIDYREVLDETTFQIFAALRTWRKGEAAAKGVPLYSVATNEQLATVARGRIRTAAALEEVGGFGSARMTKYGAAMLAVCAEMMGDGEGEA